MRFKSTTLACTFDVLPTGLVSLTQGWFSANVLYMGIEIEACKHFSSSLPPMHILPPFHSVYLTFDILHFSVAVLTLIWI